MPKRARKATAAPEQVHEPLKGFLVDANGQKVVDVVDGVEFSIPWCNAVKLRPSIKQDGAALELSIVFGECTKAERVFAIHDSLQHELTQRKLDIDALSKDKLALESRILADDNNDDLLAELNQLMKLIRLHRKRITEIEEVAHIDVTYEERHSSRSVELSAGIMTTIPLHFFRPNPQDTFPDPTIFRFSWVYLSNLETDIQQRASAKTLSESGIDKRTAGELLVESGKALFSQRRPADARKHFELAALLDNTLACGLAARLILDTDDDKRDQAFSWAERGSAQNDPLSICCLGICYLKGYGVPKDKSRFEALVEKSANLGCTFAVSARIGEQREPPFSAAAVKQLEDGVRADDLLALELLAEDLEYEEDSEDELEYESDHVYDPQRAFQLRLRLSELGSAIGINGLAYSYHYGIGTTPSRIHSAYLHQQAGDMGYRDSMSEFAAIVSSSHSRVPTEPAGYDNALAVRYYHRAIDAGAWWKLSTLIPFYEKGRGIPKDQKKAEELRAQLKLKAKPKPALP